MIDVLQLYRIDSYNYNDFVDDVFDDKVHDAGCYTACEGLSAQKKESRSHPKTISRCT